MTTVNLHPEFLTKDGEREFAVLPYSEFVALRQWMEDVEDLLALDEARSLEGNLPGVGLDEVEREFGLR